MKRILQAILFVFISSIGIIQAQVTIGSGDPPHESAVLDLKTRDNDKGFLGPRVALVSADNQSPITGNIVTGLLVYNTTDSPSNIPEKDKVKANKFYYWNEGRWVEFIEDTEVSRIVSDTINKLGIPRYAVFSMNAAQQIGNNELGLTNFLQGKMYGTARDIPLVETVNHTNGDITLVRGTGDISVIRFKKGTYSILFAYGFYGTTSAPSTCRESSYFVDFPMESVNSRARIHSNSPHGIGAAAQHGGTINYVVYLSSNYDWQVQLGLGQAADIGCYTGVGLDIGSAGFNLRNSNTFILISRIGD